MSQSLTDRYDDRIAGVLSCYDRMVITGTLPGVCYADGMTRYLNAQGIRIFDYPQFAMKLRDRVRGCAATLAAEAGVTIEQIAKVSAQPAWSTDPPRRMARMAWCALMPRRAAVPTTDLMVANRSAPQLERKPPVTLR